jgi:hypothetical protein
MKTSKIQTKVDQLISEGWKIVKWGESQMNRRFYKTCKLQKGDEFIIVNHQGGTNGLSSTLSK